MRIKWTAIPQVMTNRSSAARWGGNAVQDRPKAEAMKEREPVKKGKKKKAAQARNG